MLMVTPPVDMMCPFHHPEKGCMIYEIRPWICKKFICNRPDWNIAAEIKAQFEAGNEEFKYMDVCGVRYEIWGILDHGESVIPF
jgi:Fe-S-cluster containining protein